MKLLAISDLHCRNTAWNWVTDQFRSGYDALLIAGDVMDMQSADADPAGSSRDLIERLGNLNACGKPIFWTTGNHDWLLSHPTHSAAKKLRKELAKFANLHGPQGCWDLDSGRVHVAALPWRFPIDEALGVKLPPRGVEASILLHHAPPEETRLARNLDGDASAHGSPAIKMLVDYHQDAPHLLVCGHIHTPVRWAEKVNRTLCVNAGVGDFSDRPNALAICTENRTVTYLLTGSPRQSLKW